MEGSKCADTSRGQEAKYIRRESTNTGFTKLRAGPELCLDLSFAANQMRPQLGVILFHLIAQFAAAEGRKGGIAELLPSGAKPLLQCANVLIQDPGLGHAAKVSLEPSR
jgi:hypothetical protein